MPTFAVGYVPPGFYLQQADISNPDITPGIRVVGIIGQGSKTLARSEAFTKGASGGQDGPLTYNTVINLVSASDENNVSYRPGVDFKLTRSGDQAFVDWSLVASLVGVTDLSAVADFSILNGTYLRLVVNGGTGTPADQYVLFSGFTGATTVADVIAFINQWSASFNNGASLDAQNRLVISANSVLVEPGNANPVLGFSDSGGESAQVLEPATGVTYFINYVSDKLPAEYGLGISAGDINQIVARYGEKRPKVEFDHGTASAGATKALTDSTKAWTVDEWIGFYVRITSGTGKGQVRVVVSNTADTLTLSQDWNALMTPDSSSKYSVTDVNDNTISKGSQISQDTGATVIITSQYKDDIFNDTNIKTAITNLENDIAGTRAYTYVLMRGLGATEVDPINFIKAQLTAESGTLRDRWCSAVFGLATGNEDWTTFVNLAKAIKYHRIDLVDLTDLRRDFGFGTEQLDGSYLAAAHAGVICANELAGVPMTRRDISAAFDLSVLAEPFTNIEKNLMGGAGVTVYERRGTGLVLRDDLTTDNSTQLHKYRRTIRMADYASDFTKTRLEDLTIGQTFESRPDGTIPLINRTKANCLNLWGVLQDQGIIVRVNAKGDPGIQNFTVTENKSDSTQLDIQADLWLTPECKTAFALIGFGI